MFRRARAEDAMPNIFVSYRRDDTVGVAGRIFDRVEAEYGKDSVFMDETL
jgi:hypothetical protein